MEIGCYRKTRVRDQMYKEPIAVVFLTVLATHTVNMSNDYARSQNHILFVAQSEVF